MKYTTRERMMYGYEWDQHVSSELRPGIIFIWCTDPRRNRMWGNGYWQQYRPQRHD